MIYAGFSFEAISTADQRADFMNRTLAFLLDMPPTIAITSPSRPIEVLNASSLTLTWQATDDSGILYYDVYFDYQIIGSTTSTQYELTGIPEGEHIITLIAYDLAGHRAIDTKLILVDYSKPIITITTPLFGETITNRTLRVEWIASDPNPVATISNFSIFLNGSQVIGETPETFAIINLPDQEAYYNITITTTDSFGNLGWASIIVFLDLSAQTSTTTTSTTTSTFSSATTSSSSITTGVNSTAPPRTSEQPSLPSTSTDQGPPQFLDLGTYPLLFSILVLAIIKANFIKKRRKK